MANVADLDVSDYPGLLFLRKAVEVVPRPRERILFSGKGDITKLDGALPFQCLLRNGFQHGESGRIRCTIR